MPGVRWRTTTASTPIASMFLAVSMNVSPLDRLLPDDEKSTVSAPSRRAAREKLVCGAGEVSKNRLAQSGRPAPEFFAAAGRWPP